MIRAAEAAAQRPGVRPRWQDEPKEAAMDFPAIDPEGALRVRPEQVILGDVCRYL